MTKSIIQQKENWYAVYTRPRSEKQAHKLLTQNGFNSYLPLITTIRQWSDRKKKVQSPLISSYIFVKTNQANLINILNYNGVLRILKHLGKPAKIQDYEIENLRILLTDSDNINFIETIDLKKGDTIIVEKGVFKGLIAECLKFKGKYRIIVRVNGIKNILEVDIPLSHVKKQLLPKLQ